MNHPAATPQPALYRPQPRFDLLRAPVIGRFLRWRWGRLALQLLLLAVAVLLLYDGFTGPQLAPSNLATVSIWVHFRGLVVLALLLVGNLFCMACPFTIPRSLALRSFRPGRRWPRRLRNKWTAVAVFVAYLWLYEWFDLWASPWLTAWVVITYFIAAFVLEALFDESPFCKYVCPLGTFNYIGSTISPLQISVRSAAVCRTCVGKECINGSAKVLGCGTELFAPQVTSNLDCTFCLDCARACPHDNVALALRPPLAELTRRDAWPRRLDLNLLIVIVAFAALGNAFGMTPPVYALERQLAAWLRTDNEGVALALIFGALNLLLPIGAALGGAWLSRRLAGRQEPLRHTLARYAPAFAPLGFAVWFVHYAGFHFMTAVLTIIPVTQNFLLEHGVALFGQPNWTLGPLLPAEWLDPLEALLLLCGFGASLWVVARRAEQAAPADRLPAQLPWVLILLGLMLATLIVFGLPMEMRGTAFG